MPDTQPQASLTFVGTATTLLRLGAFTLLTDPNFLHRGQRAWLGKGLWSRRLTEPAMGPGDLPALDAVLLSHLHGDHWDRVATASLPRHLPVLTTPHAARRLQRKGFVEADGLTTWSRVVLQRPGERLTVTSMPAVHAYGVMGRLLPPVMGSMLEHCAGSVTTRVYVTGDTLTGTHLDEIARRYPQVDAAVVHLGGTRVLARTVTMDAAQGLDLVRRTGPRRVVPVHHEDYPVFRSRLADFTAGALACGLAGRVSVVERGSSVDLRSGANGSIACGTHGAAIAGYAPDHRQQTEGR